MTEDDQFQDECASIAAENQLHQGEDCGSPVTEEDQMQREGACTTVTEDDQFHQEVEHGTDSPSVKRVDGSPVENKRLFFAQTKTLRKCESTVTQATSGASMERNTIEETQTYEVPTPSEHHIIGKPEEDKSKRDNFKLKVRLYLKKLAVFWPIKVMQLLCVAYILILTFSKAPIGLVDRKSGNIIDPNSLENTNDGVIYINGDYRPVVAEGIWQKFCLAMSRMSAFSMYPMLILIFFTKCKACHSVLYHTPLSMFLFLHESHELHAYAGRYIAVDACIHTFFHLLRWVDQGNVSLLWVHKTGLWGLIVIISVPLIALPMIFWKQQIPYEIRKGLHYLFFLFAVGMCFHVPISAIPNGGFIAPVMVFCICLYTLDATYVYLFMTEKIETPTFHVLSSGVQITMPVSDAFRKRCGYGGFAYACLPWVDRMQWHAFSIFEDPAVPTNRQVFLMKNGDWTNAVHKALQRDTVRPVWIQGPFPSPYNQAEMYDNQILVASGIGITPALAVIRAHKSSRRINLIWAVRDPAMLEFFLEHMYLDHDGWNLIFYTGKEPLLPALEEVNTNLRIIKGRPNLRAVIPNIIYGIESGVGLPETYTPSEMVRMKGLVIERMRDLDNTSKLSSTEKLKELTAFANAHGFLFTELMNAMNTGNKRPKTCPHEEYTSEGEVQDQEFCSYDENTRRASDVLRQVREFGEWEYGHHDDNRDDDQPHCSLLSDAKSVGHCDSITRSTFGDKQQNMWMSIRQSFTPCMSGRKVSKALTSTFRPWEKNHEAERFVMSLDREQILPTWGILYCGGSPPVQKALKKISAECGLSLNIDSFAW